MSATMWQCPGCERRFGKANQSHECAPALSIEEYFETGPSFERPIFEAVREHMQSLDPDIWFEPVSVGIFFKRRTSFVQLRTKTKWVALCFNLNRKLTSTRLARKVIEHSGRYYHVVNIREPGDLDEQIFEWLTEAFDADAPASDPA